MPDSDSAGMGWGLRLCMSLRLPGSAETAQSLVDHTSGWVLRLSSTLCVL